MVDSQRFALENSPQIAKIIAILQNFRRYCRKVILYPICLDMPSATEDEQRCLKKYQVSSYFENGIWSVKLKLKISFHYLIGDKVSSGWSQLFKSKALF